MEKFTTLHAIAAPLPLANIDTDTIIPARFLKTIRRTGLGVHLFNTLRHDPEGAERPDFVLNREPWRHARILIAYENFGCGSSREHAAWALLDFGIRCVIAPDFADIFHANAFKNGILPVALPRAACETLVAAATHDPRTPLTVDLHLQQVIPAHGPPLAFQVDPFRRELLLGGLDDIDQTLRFAAEIDAYERRVRAERPFLPSIPVPGPSAP